MCETARDKMIRLAVEKTSNASNIEQEKRDDQSTCTVTLKSPGSPPKDRRKCQNDDPALDVDTSFGPRAPERHCRTSAKSPLLSLSEMSPPSRPIQLSLMLLPSVVGTLELLKHSVKKAGPC